MTFRCTYCRKFVDIDEEVPTYDGYTQICVECWFYYNWSKVASLVQSQIQKNRIGQKEGEILLEATKKVLRTIDVNKSTFSQDIQLKKDAARLLRLILSPEKTAAQAPQQSFQRPSMFLNAASATVASSMPPPSPAPLASSSLVRPSLVSTSQRAPSLARPLPPPPSFTYTERPPDPLCLSCSERYPGSTRLWADCEKHNTLSTPFQDHFPNSQGKNPYPSHPTFIGRSDNEDDGIL